jgi:hypothetical protein
MKKILAFVTFSQSKTYPTDWKVRTEYKDGYKNILTTDIISKETRFGEKPNKEQMENFAKMTISEIAQSFGFEYEVMFK